MRGTRGGVGHHCGGARDDGPDVGSGPRVDRCSVAMAFQAA